MVQRHAQSGSKLCSWLMFSKTVNESEKHQSAVILVQMCFFSDI